jgi:hypothetical protein
MTTSPEQEITYGFETTTTTALMATFSGNASGGGGGSSSNDSAEIVADLRRWPHAFLSWYIAAPGAAIAMIPFGLLTLAVNVITCLALIAERALQTTLYTYLASLAACDVIGAAIITPLAAASLYYGRSTARGEIVIFRADLIERR